MNDNHEDNRDNHGDDDVEDNDDDQNQDLSEKKPLLLRNSQNLIKIAPKFNFHFTVEIVNMDNWKCLFKPGMLPLQNQSVESA